MDVSIFGILTASKKKTMTKHWLHPDPPTTEKQEGIAKRISVKEKNDLLTSLKNGNIYAIMFKMALICMFVKGHTS